MHVGGGGAVCRGEGAGAGVHEHAGVGRESALPPRGRQGHRILRWQDRQIRGLSRHGCAPGKRGKKK